MSLHIHTTKNDKKIFVFDDVIDFAVQTIIYKFIKDSYFRVIGIDNPSIETKDPTLVSNYTIEDLEKSGFIIPKEVLDKIPLLDLFNIENIMVNLCKPDDIFHVHTDHFIKNAYTLIYYTNLKWDIEYGGDTVFLDEHKNIEFVSQYIPGRIVVFDSSIPHLIRPSTRLAPDYRFTLAIRFEPK
jgi:hypothetical protein